jgi:hypothetical protein
VIGVSHGKEKLNDGRITEVAQEWTICAYPNHMAGQPGQRKYSAFCRYTCSSACCGSLQMVVGPGSVTAVGGLDNVAQVGAHVSRCCNGAASAGMVT